MIDGKRIGMLKQSRDIMRRQNKLLVILRIRIEEESNTGNANES